MRGWMLRSERRRRRLRDTVALAAAATCAAAIAAPAAGAATWGYEQVTPHDSETSEPIAVGVSEDLSTTFVGTLGDPIPGQPADGRSGIYWYGLPHTGGLWNVGPVDVRNGFQIIKPISDISADGQTVLLGSADDLLREGISGGGLYAFRSDGSGVNLSDALGPVTDARAATPSLDRVAFMPTTSPGLYLSSQGGPPELISVDDDGNPMDASRLGGAGQFGQESYRTGAVSADGSSVIFGSTTALDGDGDSSVDLYRRVLTPGAERTILVSDDTASADPDPSGDALYRWSSTDHQRVVWRTTAALGDGDADTAADLYLRVGDGPPQRITKGEVVEGDQTGNSDAGDAEWVATAGNGDLVYFVTYERLTDDAPAGLGYKLYERDVADGVTRFVAGPLGDDETIESTDKSFVGDRDPDTSFRPVRPIPGGLILQSSAPLTGEDDGGLFDVFRWTRGGGLELLSAPEAGAPASPAADALIMAVNPSRFDEFIPYRSGRVVTADGSRLFLTTAESLTGDDTDGGHADVYAWSAGEGFELVSPPGGEPYDATYLESSPDGSRVWFQTAATILPSDTDPNTIDTYLAILGGGQAPGKPSAPQGPAGPGGGSSGGGSTVPPTLPPASASPLPPETEAPPVVEGPGGRGDDGARRGEIGLRPVRSVRGGVAVLRVEPSAAGELRVRATARLRRKGKARRVGSATEAVQPGPTRVRVELSRRAERRLDERGRLRVRFVVRLDPSAGARGVTERTTVTLRSGERR